MLSVVAGLWRAQDRIDAFRAAGFTRPKGVVRFYQLTALLTRPVAGLGFLAAGDISARPEAAVDSFRVERNAVGCIAVVLDILLVVFAERYVAQRERFIRRKTKHGEGKDRDKRESAHGIPPYTDLSPSHSAPTWRF